jgi:hypothetical protein
MEGASKEATMPFLARLAVVTAPVFIFALSACAGGNSCPEGAYKNAETNVCIKLPADFKADDKVGKAGEASYLTIRNSKTLKSFSIWIEKPDDLDKRAKVVENMASADMKLVASGDTSPSKGKFFHLHNGPGNYDFAVALVPGKEHFYRCEIQNTPPDEAKPMLEACKTVGGP